MGMLTPFCRSASDVSLDFKRCMPAWAPGEVGGVEHMLQLTCSGRSLESALHALCFVHFVQV